VDQDSLGQDRSVPTEGLAPTVELKNEVADRPPEASGNDLLVPRRGSESDPVAPPVSAAPAPEDAVPHAVDRQYHDDDAITKPIVYDATSLDDAFELLETLALPPKLFGEAPEATPEATPSSCAPGSKIEVAKASDTLDVAEGLANCDLSGALPDSPAAMPPVLNADEVAASHKASDAINTDDAVVAGRREAPADAPSNIANEDVGDIGTDVKAFSDTASSKSSDLAGGAVATSHPTEEPTDGCSITAQEAQVENIVTAEGIGDADASPVVQTSLVPRDSDIVNEVSVDSDQVVEVAGGASRPEVPHLADTGMADQEVIPPVAAILSDDPMAQSGSDEAQDELPMFRPPPRLSTAPADINDMAMESLSSASSCFDADAAAALDVSADADEDGAGLPLPEEEHALSPVPAASPSPESGVTGPSAGGGPELKDVEKEAEQECPPSFASVGSTALPSRGGSADVEKEMDMEEGKDVEGETEQQKEQDPGKVIEMREESTHDRQMEDEQERPPSFASVGLAALPSRGGSADAEKDMDIERGKGVEMETEQEKDHDPGKVSEMEEERTHDRAMEDEQEREADSTVSRDLRLSLESSLADKDSFTSMDDEVGAAALASGSFSGAADSSIVDMTEMRNAAPAHQPTDTMPQSKSLAPEPASAVPAEASQTAWPVFVGTEQQATADEGELRQSTESRADEGYVDALLVASFESTDDDLCVDTSTSMMRPCDGLGQSPLVRTPLPLARQGNNLGQSPMEADEEDAAVEVDKDAGEEVKTGTPLDSEIASFKAEITSASLDAEALESVAGQESAPSDRGVMKESADHVNDCQELAPESAVLTSDSDDPRLHPDIEAHAAATEGKLETDDRPGWQAPSDVVEGGCDLR